MCYFAYSNTLLEHTGAVLHCRFCHTVQRQHAHNEEMSDELSSALNQINNTSKEANKLNDQLGRETNTLDERKYVSSNRTIHVANVRSSCNVLCVGRLVQNC